jgi:hypothetical protein
MASERIIDPVFGELNQAHLPWQGAENAWQGECAWTPKHRVSLRILILTHDEELTEDVLVVCRATYAFTRKNEWQYRLAASQLLLNLRTERHLQPELRTEAGLARRIELAEVEVYDTGGACLWYANNEPYFPARFVAVRLDSAGEVVDVAYIGRDSDP